MTTLNYKIRNINLQSFRDEHLIKENKIVLVDNNLHVSVNINLYFVFIKNNVLSKGNNNEMTTIPLNMNLNNEITTILLDMNLNNEMTTMLLDLNLNKYCTQPLISLPT